MRYLLLVLLLAGCGLAQTEPVVLKHPKTGKIVQCGPYRSTIYGIDGATVARENQCIRDYKEQGYIRK